MKRISCYREPSGDGCISAWYGKRCSACGTWHDNAQMQGRTDRKKQFRIILTQGLNRQIRRMCEYFGYRVQKLVRVRIMNIELGDLESGKYRDVTPEEFKKLKQLIAHSSNQPVRPMEKSQKSKRKPRNSAIHGTYTVVNHHIDRENKNGNRKATD